MPTAASSGCATVFGDRAAEQDGGAGEDEQRQRMAEPPGQPVLDDVADAACGARRCWTPRRYDRLRAHAACPEETQAPEFRTCALLPSSLRAQRSNPLPTNWIASATLAMTFVNAYATNWRLPVRPSTSSNSPCIAAQERRSACSLIERGAHHRTVGGRVGETMQRVAVADHLPVPHLAARISFSNAATWSGGASGSSAPVSTSTLALTLPGAAGSFRRQHAVKADGGLQIRALARELQHHRAAEAETDRRQSARHRPAAGLRASPARRGRARAAFPARRAGRRRRLRPPADCAPAAARRTCRRRARHSRARPAGAPAPSRNRRAPAPRETPARPAAAPRLLSSQTR